MVYLLHFSKPIGGPRHFASYYLGWTLDRPGALSLRLSWHRRGLGSRITAAAVAQGCELELVRTWPKGDRRLERKLKNRKNHKRLVQEVMA
jgi:hypothetical protein